MRISLSGTFRHSLTATAVTVLTLLGQGSATAQFAPANAQYQPTQQNQLYQQQNQRYQQQVAVQPGYGQIAQQPVQQYQQQPAQQYQQQPVPQYTAMAYQGGAAINAAESIQPQAATVQPQGLGFVPQGDAAAANCGTCQTNPAPAYESYPGPGCTTGNCGVGGYSSYNTFANCGTAGYGIGNCGTGYGNMGCAADRTCGRRWFGGVYGLLMERDGGNRIPLAFTTTTPGAGYYPTNTEVVLTTEDVDIGYQGGAEIRFGSTINRLGRGAAYGGGGCCSCGPQYAWEAAYWGIAEDSGLRQINDVATFGTDGNRTYGMIDFRGLEYSSTGLVADYRSVNHYFDYGPPVEDHTPGFTTDIEIRSLIARSTFSVQNVEINLLRLPVLSGGSCWTGCNSCGCDAGGCDGGGCATGGCDVAGCSTGYGMGGLRRGRRFGGRGSYCGPKYSLTTMLGARYMRFDEDFYLRSNFDVVTGGTTTGNGFLAYNVEADNDLIGLQLGCNGIYRLGCTGRFALHCNSSLGIYGNHISMYQRMDTPTGGTLRFANGTNANFDVRSSKDDVAMVGELRLGGSYQAGCNWRLYGGWRVIGISGIALSTNQIPTAFITPEQVGTIASNGSMLLHGLQVGTEWTY